MTQTIQSMLNNISNLKFLDLNFWFRNQGVDSLLEISIWSVVFLILACTGIATLIYNSFVVKTYPPKNKILKPAGIGLIVISVAGQFFALFNWQGIDFLGVRAFEILFILSGLAWMGFFFWKYNREVTRESIKYEARLIKKKYFK